MQITFKQSVFVGERTYAEGESADFPEPVAKRLIESGDGFPSKAGEQIETATAPQQQTETATVKAEPKAKGK